MNKFCDLRMIVSFYNTQKSYLSFRSTAAIEFLLRSSSGAKEIQNVMRHYLRNIHGRPAYSNVRVKNFTSSWADGLAFCALLHRFLGIPALLDAEDMSTPEQFSIITYVSQYYHRFQNSSNATSGVASITFSPNDTTNSFSAVIAEKPHPEQRRIPVAEVEERAIMVAQNCITPETQSTITIAGQELINAGAYIEKQKKPTSEDIPSITRNKKAASSLFGLPIEHGLTENCSNMDVPQIAQELIECLSRKKYLHTEGIFRVASDKNRVKSLKADYDKAFTTGYKHKVDLLKYADESAHTVAAVLKLYLYYLPEPLLLPSPSFMSHWHDVIRDRGVERGIDSLPARSRALVEYLFDYLAKLVGAQQNNKLSASTVSKIFGPILLPNKAAPSPEHTKMAESILKMLIELRSEHSSSTRAITTSKALPVYHPDSELETEATRIKKRSEENTSVMSIAALQKQVQMLTGKISEKEKSINNLKQGNEAIAKRQKDSEMKMAELEKLWRIADNMQNQLKEKFAARDKKLVEQEKTVESLRAGDRTKIVGAPPEDRRDVFSQQTNAINQQMQRLQSQIGDKSKELEQMQKDMQSLRQSLLDLEAKSTQEQQNTIELQDMMKQIKTDNLSLHWKAPLGRKCY
ncbi:hypothetical protein PROFUN_01348 [Planoprotostelium fungivorum]|uniref:Rho-GAP domain-containing protein n=1 Tax=Planoprotostelium fungivorum TaxID=1890364 RepID=A0A2P6NZT4_9EUKA|nr:hypothetical protein PROFUN_01348 [Planoprotostelium fungivorum]